MRKIDFKLTKSMSDEAETDVRGRSRSGAFTKKVEGTRDNFGARNE